MKRVDWSTLREMAPRLRKPYHDNYYAMYSSVYGGIVTDPVLMTVPVDDHVVHRGDGVFETFKCVGGRIYNMGAHLARLERGLVSLGYDIHHDAETIASVVVETIRAGGKQDCSVRVIVSRGPGSMGVNPYDTDGPQLYVIVTRLAKPFMATHPEGASIITTSVPVKRSVFAQTKSCNYLPNVLMQKEALDAGADFVAIFDDDGFLAEGATENIGIVTQGGDLLFPSSMQMLQGTTMIRVVELAASLVDGGVLSNVGNARISREMILDASEVLIVGTSRDVTSAKEFDGVKIGDGCPGPVRKALDDLMQVDMVENNAILTVVFITSQ